MTPNLDKLEKVLKLEAQKGCLDTAVIGGLQRFLANWLTEYISAAQTGRAPVLTRHIKSGAAKYGVLTAEQRKTWLAKALALLKPLDDAPVQTRPAAATKTKPEQDQIEASSRQLDAEITCIKGISSAMAQKLARLGITTVRDMLFFFPHRHLDYSRLKTVSQLVEGREETVMATVWEAREVKIKNRRSTEAVLGDKTGNVRAVWFNNPYMVKQLVGTGQIILSGRVRFFGGRPVFESPDWEAVGDAGETVHTGRLVPVYPLTRGLYQRSLRKMVKAVVDRYVSSINEFLPQTILKRNSLLSFQEALRQAHFPDTTGLKDRARTRLAFNELFILQLGVLQKKKQWQSVPAKPISVDAGVTGRFIGSLPFTLTGAQQRVISEILADISKPVPMSRLLQGEVGSGKTVVALTALLAATADSRQGALMAPTEILAQQHFKSVSGMLSATGRLVPGKSEFTASFEGILPRPVSVALLTSDIKAREKKSIKEGIEADNIDILIGTHAIIQEEVNFNDLGLVVIDEQHRFGVVQRQILRHKGDNPHMLVMTATPIPRTLALTLYGDLDLSVIDVLPPGRQVIKTRWLQTPERYKAYNFIRKQTAEGRQAFIVCPLVEESDSLQARAATAEFEQLSGNVFPGLRLGLLHGRMKSNEKENVMRQFNAGKLDILVTTPVVEVGIDVPNATVIMIESANRFGLSQLHQFRGRVGRGQHQSYCMLLAETTTETGAERLKAIEEIQDGFKLAEKDLELRGPGEFFGTRQSGLPDLKMAKLSDTGLLEKARQEAVEVFRYDASLTRSEHRQLADEMKRVWAQEPAEKS